MPLSLHLLRKLDNALIGRRVGEAFKLLEQANSALSALFPSDPLAASYLVCVAQCIDLGYGDIHFLDRLLKRFSDVHQEGMLLADYLQLRMVEGFRAFAWEDLGAATKIFGAILPLQMELKIPRLLFSTHFWKARAHRKQGNYEAAMEHILEARRLAEEIPAPKLVAVVEIHESWLLFQRGQRRESMHLLDKAESELKETGHALSLGNIESARGRFVRRSGEYASALEHFHRAISIYSTRFPNHPNLARALVNAAYVKRLIALDMSRSTHSGRAQGALHARYLEICQDALSFLDRAKAIYAMHHHPGGTGAVLVNAGYLHLESGDTGRASEEAIKAFHLGQENHDPILMARARILQAYIENTSVEEQLGDAADVAVHANLAARYADESIEWAKQTQNKRLLAGAYIARGLTATNDFFAEWEPAKQFASMAANLLGPEDKDHLSKELSLLKSRILRETGIDQTLRSWSQGLVGDKTFQQLTEEFAEIVIPKVWLQEDRKIAKVAERLSMSPKKVRRILRNAHLLKRGS
jgi:tetratricopeptide (TPR) repeat protein